VADRYCMDFPSRRFYHALGRRERLGLGPMTHHGQLRWYNPTLEDFEWRAVPTTDEQALEVLEGSPYSATCAQTYREWRQLGASIEAALMRAGEAAKEQSQDEEREGDDAR
jgi:hypothetical protein